MEPTQEARTDIVVVGGGMAGLVAATLAARSGAAVTLIDSARLGAMPFS
jgi:flavin-dependent dehydrogenase